MTMTDKWFYNDRITSNDHQLNRLEALDKTFHTFVAMRISVDDRIEVKAKFTFPKLHR